MKRNKAFTMIELLIVVIIVAILAAIAIPIFNQAAVTAEMDNTASNLEQELNALLIELERGSFLYKIEDTRVCEANRILNRFLFTDYAYADGPHRPLSGIEFEFGRNASITTRRDIGDNRIAIITIKTTPGAVYRDGFSIEPSRIPSPLGRDSNFRFSSDAISFPFRKGVFRVTESAMFITCNRKKYEIIKSSTGVINEVKEWPAR